MIRQAYPLEINTLMNKGSQFHAVKTVIINLAVMKTADYFHLATETIL